MNDWVACETCKTIFEYDPVRRIAQCPYCQKPEQIPADREAKTGKAGGETGARKNNSQTGAAGTDREHVPTDKRRSA